MTVSKIKESPNKTKTKKTLLTNSVEQHLKIFLKRKKNYKNYKKNMKKTKEDSKKSKIKSKSCIIKPKK
jgi:hypothetical protein